MIRLFVEHNKKQYDVALHTSCDIEFEPGEMYLVTQTEVAVIYAPGTALAPQTSPPAR